MAANERFFEQRQPAAVFKHGILSRYSTVFAAKAGSVTAGRVVFLDGYAGAGRYEDGSPGSPLLFVRSAQNLSARRTVTGIFVEQDPRRFASLNVALDEADPQQAVPRVVRGGDLGPLLPELIDLAAGAALLVFLDPFGTALDLNRLRGAILGRPGRAPTEVLLHFSTSTIARIGGMLRPGRAISLADRKTISRADAFLGGRWWHDEFATLAARDARADEAGMVTATDVALRVASRFCTGVGRHTGYRAVTMPVRPEPGYAPKYVLALFTRNPHGVWHFADALGHAGLDWAHAVYDNRIRAEQDRRDKKHSQAAEPEGLFDLADLNALTPPPPSFEPAAYEHEHANRWINTIAENLLRLLGEHGGVRMFEHIDAVYGEVMGQAMEKHVRAAVKQLYQGKLITDDGVGRDFWQRLIRLSIPGPTPAGDGSATRARPTA